MDFGLRLRDWRATVGVVTGGHLLSHFYLLAFPPIFPFLRDDFGLSNTELGVLVSAMALPMLLQMPVGRVVDRVGAKWVLAVAIGVTAGGVALAGVAGSYPLLLAASALSGLGQSGFHPANYALLGAVTGDDSEGKSFGVHTFGGYAGFAAAPLVVGGLAIRYDWRLALVSVGLVGIGYAAATTLTLDPVYRRQLRTEADERVAEAAEREAIEREREGTGDDGATDADTERRAGTDGTSDDGDATGTASTLLAPTVLVLFVFFVVFNMAGKGLQTFTTLFVVEHYGFSEAAGNTTLTAFFAAAAAGILVGGVLADRFDPRRVVVAALGVAGGLLLLVVTDAFPANPAVVVAWFGLVGFVTGLAYPSRDRLVSEHVGAGSRGTSFGFVFTGLSLGGLVSPALLGVVADASTVIAAFGLVGALYLLSAATAFGVGRRSVDRVAARLSRSD